MSLPLFSGVVPSGSHVRILSVGGGLEFKPVGGGTVRIVPPASGTYDLTLPASLPGSTSLVSVLTDGSLSFDDVDRVNVGPQSAIFSPAGAARNLDLAFNAYHDGTTWRTRVADSAATLVEVQKPGSQNFAVYAGAADGTADAAITWTTVFRTGQVSGNIGTATAGSLAVGSGTFSTSEQLRVVAGSGRTGLRIDQAAGGVGQIIKVAGTSNPFEVHPAASSTPVASIGPTGKFGIGRAVGSGMLMIQQESGADGIMGYGPDGLLGYDLNVNATGGLATFRIRNATTTAYQIAGANATTTANGVYQWTSDANGLLSADLRLRRGAANRLDIDGGAGVAAQLRVDNVYTTGASPGFVGLWLAGGSAIRQHTAGTTYFDADTVVFRTAASGSGVGLRVGTTTGPRLTYGAVGRLDIDGGSGVAGALRVLSATPATDYAELSNSSGVPKFTLATSGGSVVGQARTGPISGIFGLSLSGALEPTSVFAGSGTSGVFTAIADGYIRLQSASGSANFVRHTESGVANRGTHGFAAGSADWQLRLGATGMTDGTERLRVAGADGFLTHYGTATVSGNGRLTAGLFDTTAMAAGVGAGFYVGGKYTAAGAYTGFGAVSGVKVNATDGNYAGRLVLTARANGLGYTEFLRGESDGTPTPMIGFLGAAAVARQTVGSEATGGATVDAEARASLAAIRTALINLGLCAA